MNHNPILQFNNDIPTDRIYRRRKNNSKQHNQIKIVFLFLCLGIFTLFIISNIKSSKSKQLSTLNINLKQQLSQIIKDTKYSESKYNEKVKEIEKEELRLQMKQFLIDQIKSNLTKDKKMNEIKDNKDMNELKKQISELSNIFRSEKEKEKEYLIKIRDVNMIIENKEYQCKRISDDINQKKIELGKI